jgi:hypothetical protein
VKIEYSNCILQASLYDIATGEMGAALQATLEPPAGAIEQLTPALTGMMAVGLFSAVIPAMLKE